MDAVLSDIGYGVRMLRKDRRFSMTAILTLAICFAMNVAVFTVVNDDVWRSTDDGGTWQPARAREVFPWHYPRGIAVKPNDSRTVFVTVGDTTPGRIGTVMRSRDAGATWQSLGLPVQPNSAVWTVSVPASAPDTVLAASRYGYLYRSDDGGESWRKLWREFGEVSSILWVAQS